MDLPTRLSLSTVSTTWRTAALAATHTVQHRSSSKANTGVLQAWLATRGRSVQAVQLSVAYHSEEDIQLHQWDCPRLQTLSLSHMNLSHLDDSPSPAAPTTAVATMAKPAVVRALMAAGYSRVYYQLALRVSQTLPA